MATQERLATKIRLLQLKVADNIQASSLAVKQTAEGVHDTFASIENAINVRHRIAAHPWISLGGAIAIAALLSSRRDYRPARLPRSDEEVDKTRDAMVTETDIGPTAAEATTRRPLTSTSNYFTSIRNSILMEARTIAVAACIGLVREVAIRAVPLVLSRFPIEPNGKTVVTETHKETH